MFNNFKSKKQLDHQDLEMLRRTEESALSDVVEFLKNTISIGYDSNKTPVFTQKT